MVSKIQKKSSENANANCLKNVSTLKASGWQSKIKGNLYKWLAINRKDAYTIFNGYC